MVDSEWLKCYFKLVEKHPRFIMSIAILNDSGDLFELAIPFYSIWCVTLRDNTPSDILTTQIGLLYISMLPIRATISLCKERPML